MAAELEVSSLAGEALLAVSIDEVADMVVAELDELLSVIGSVKWKAEEEDVVFISDGEILDDNMRLVDLEAGSQDETTIHLQRVVQNPICFFLHTDIFNGNAPPPMLRVSRRKAARMTVGDLKRKFIEKDLLMRNNVHCTVTFDGRELQDHRRLQQVLPLDDLNEIDIGLCPPELPRLRILGRRVIVQHNIQPIFAVFPVRAPVPALVPPPVHLPRQGFASFAESIRALRLPLRPHMPAMAPAQAAGHNLAHEHQCEQPDDLQVTLQRRLTASLNQGRPNMF
jgi:hypothetical protein